MGFHQNEHAMKGSRDSLCAMVGEIVSKSQVRRRIFQQLLVAFLTISRRINFRQLARLGWHHESTWHDWFSKNLDLKTFNMDLIKRHGSGNWFVIFDPSFLSKSGKKTPHIGRFWSGCAQAVKRGLEMGSFAVGDFGHRTAFHLNASLTPSPVELKKGGQTLVGHYVAEVVKNRAAIAQFGNKLAADGFFGVSTFVNPVAELGVEVISCLRANAVLFYAPDAPKTPKRGRPRKKGARIDWKNLDDTKLAIVFSDAEKRVRAGLVYANALKRIVRLVAVEFLRPDGCVQARKLLFSTNLKTEPAQIEQCYQGRFQIEFLFRDAKQFTGLSHCQSTNLLKIENHLNLSMTAVSVAKMAHHLSDANEFNPPFSMAQITDYYRNLHFVDQFSQALGLNPTLTKNNPNIKKLLFSMSCEAIAA